MNTIAPVIYIALLGGFYALGYVMNHKTPVPEGCENIKAECEGCKITTCSNHPINDETKGEI